MIGCTIAERSGSRTLREPEELSAPKLVNAKTLLTDADYVEIPDDGNRHEIISGEHFVTPSPVTRHQRISRHIHFQLYEAIELRGLGEV